MYRHSRPSTQSVLHTWVQHNQRTACIASTSIHPPLAFSLPTHLAGVRAFSSTLPSSSSSSSCSTSTGKCRLRLCSSPFYISVRHYTRKKKRTTAAAGRSSPNGGVGRASAASASPHSAGSASSPGTGAQRAALRSISSGRVGVEDDDDGDYADDPTTAEKAPSPFPGDAVFSSPPATSSDEAERLRFEEERALRRYARKKRPDRSPFNPLPDTYDDDEEVDLPHEVMMDRAAYEELTDEEQLRIRTHQGLIRLRRNEQKLQRLLQMQKPDRVDLLMLLNEVESLQGMERRMHEKYIGPKVGIEQLEADLDFAFSWKGLEDSDMPEIVGDDQAVAMMRERRAEEEDETKTGEGEGGEEQKQISGAGPSGLITQEAMWEAEDKLRLKQIATRKKRALESGNSEDALEPENPARERLLEAHEQMLEEEEEGEEERAGKEPELHEPLLADEVVEQQLKEMRTNFPDGYEEDYQDDEFFEAEAAQDLDAEVELMTRNVDDDVDLLELSSEERADAAKDVEERRKDLTVQALLAPSDEVQRVLSKGKLSKSDLQLLREVQQKDEEELCVLREHSTLWRVKQEIVAEWRAAMEGAGQKLEEAEVAAFLEGSDDDGEEALREVDEVEQEAAFEGELYVERVRKQIRKQKKWLAELRETFGEAAVKEAIRDGDIQLKTHAALAEALREEALVAAAEGVADLSQLEAEMQSLDAEVAKMFGLSVEDVQKLTASPDADVTIPSLEERQRLYAERLPERMDKDAQRFNSFLSSVLNRDLSAEAAAAEAEGDEVAAKKLRFMHSRRMEYEQSEEEESRSSVSREDLRRLGEVLAEGNEEGDPNATSYAIQRVQFGRVMTEEALLNRQLIARGDGDNPRFVDEDVRDEANQVSFSPAIFIPPEQLRIREEGRGEEAASVGERGPQPDVAYAEKLIAANNAAYLEYQQLSEEKKLELSDADERLHREENDAFDDYILSQLPLKLHKKAVRDWNRLSETDRTKVILKGRENRDKLRAWMGERLLTYSEDEHQADPLTQYYIDEPDPKLYNAIEGAFWHVGRWGLDERTEEEKQEGLSRRIVPRFRPDVPETQTRLDEVEAELFGLGPDELTEEDINQDEDMTEEDKQVYKARLRRAKGQQAQGVRHVDLQTEDGDGQAALQLSDASEEAESDDTDDASADLQLDAVDEEAQSDAAEEAEMDTREDDDMYPERLEDEEGDVAVRANGVDADEDEELYDEFDEEQEDPDAPDARLARRGFRADVADADEGEDVDDVDDDDESKLPPTVDGEESLLQQRKRQENQARRLKFQDFDPIPTGDQRAFDDRYFHFDEEDWAMLHKLDPIGVQANKHMPPVSEQTASNYYSNDDIKGQNVLSEDTRRALFYLHKSNPSVWTPATLAMRFRMSHAHMKGILTIEAADQRNIDHGMEDTRSVGDERMAPSESTMNEMRTFISMQRFKRHMVQRGHDGEMIPLFDKEGHDTDCIEPMLHYLPRLARPRVADVRFVSENDLQAVLEEERDVEERFLSYQQRIARREAEEYERTGAIGTPTHPKYARKADPNDNYQHPKIIEEGRLQPPINYHLVLTDVTERSRDRFSLAVRDVTGYLRQPTPVEFMAVRRREKNAKARFVNVEYKHEKDTPL